jgi:hypothetical protein
MTALDAHRLRLVVAFSPGSPLCYVTRLVEVGALYSEFQMRSPATFGASSGANRGRGFLAARRDGESRVSW